VLSRLGQVKILDIINEIRLYRAGGLGLGGVKTTDAGGRRELAHHGVLPIVAGGAWPGRCDLYCDVTTEITHDGAGSILL
jgi:hypothetical protein